MGLACLQDHNVDAVFPEFDQIAVIRRNQTVVTFRNFFATPDGMRLPSRAQQKSKANRY